MKTLREIMREGFIFAVQRTAPVAVAARVMETHNVGIVAVVDGARLVGVFSERDVVRPPKTRTTSRRCGRSIRRTSAICPS
ncbi:MAG: CBS domain-containing protein [Deltaproteobacteria bacterium]|nr:MAG: CBS domain-containing protein [Deltaproteobacteria bacterium]